MQIRGSTCSTSSKTLLNPYKIKKLCTTSYSNVLPLETNFNHFFRSDLIFSDQFSNFIITLCAKIEMINWLITSITSRIFFNIEAHRMSFTDLITPGTSINSFFHNISISNNRKVLLYIFYYA